MASKNRNMFYRNKKQEMTEIGTVIVQIKICEGNPVEQRNTPKARKPPHNFSSAGEPFIVPVHTTEYKQICLKVFNDSLLLCQHIEYQEIMFYSVHQSAPSREPKSTEGLKLT
ncbi:hypothetical protein AAG570_005882 [Ranatra chinensis]|uniref:Uncharacterized protein n=1 Tax=Ranatra chinensis TaxID=642074 RepID=A0ABD0XWE5_9HEMI